MSSVTRWDPFRDVTTLRDAMGQLFEQAVLRPGMLPGGVEAAGLGQMDVLETDGRYLCQVWLPGVNPDDVELTVRQNTLNLHVKMGEPFTEEQRKKGTYLLREFGANEITRSIAFPKDVDADAIEAHYDRGILAIMLPLARHAQPRRVRINETSKPAQQIVESGHAEPKGHKEPALAGANGSGPTAQ